MKTCDSLSLQQIQQRANLQLARRNLADFATYTDQLYRMGWHHRLICGELDRFVAKDTRRLMIFTPPRHGKSELVSRKLPAFIFGKDPDARVIATSYSADLAQRMNRDAQRIMDSDSYGEVFPGTALWGKNVRMVADGSFLRNNDIFEIVNQRGVYRCAGVGGGITGMGGDFIIIDDPIKNREEANSATYRDKLFDWYTSTLYTRLQKDGCILLTLTRWHEDDLAGRLLNASGDWRVIELPAICEEPGLHDYDPRGEGEALWPGEYSVEALAETKRTVGSYDWSALYQQHPSPGEGGIFKREWWQYYDAPPAKLFDFLQSWDCAFKDTETSDYVVGQVWARDQRNPADRYLLDQVRGRMNFSETLRAMRNLTAKWRQCNRKLVEDKANGTAVIQVLRKEIPGIVPVNPEGGKVVRANAVTAAVEAGNVYVPNPAHTAWVGDFIEELSNFPSGKHDDQVDAMTQANSYYNDKAGLLGEGIIYKLFVSAQEKYQICAKDLQNKRIDNIYVGVNFGSSRVGVAFVAVGICEGYSEVIALKSALIREELNPATIGSLFVPFLAELEKEYGIPTYVYCDNEETALYNSIKQSAYDADPPVSVRGAAKVPAIDCVRLTLGLLAQDRFHITGRCTTLKEAMEDALWEPGGSSDKRLDDGSTDIATLTAFEYAIERSLRHLIDAGRSK